MTLLNKNPFDETFVLNLGPQHPATHGVLRIKIELDGEYIVEAEPVLGYIHRMHEKMAEGRSWTQFLPNVSRLDYLHALGYCHGYVSLVEKAAGIEVPERAEYLRVITVELNRLSSHLLWMGVLVLDLGGFSPLLYAFDDREHVLDLLESVTGARLTYCYFRFGGVYNDIDDNFIVGTRAFIKRLRARITMYHELVTKNIILIRRIKDTGIISTDLCVKYGVTGPIARASGLDFDVRRHEPYSLYPEFDFDVPVRQEGDSMSRYWVRVEEMEQSMRIIEQALDKLPAGPVMAAKVPRMIKPPVGDYYQAVETARGSLGYRAVSDGTNKPYRLKIRPPTFSNVSLYGEACKGMLLSDALALLGSLDLVIPEMDK